MTAAKESRYADSAVGNVTGSNSVNVFLGLGLPWVIAVIYSEQNNTVYEVPAEGLAISVIMFLCCSLVGISLLVIRRFCCKGELGGPTGSRVCSAIFMVSLWLVYVSVSSAYMYGAFDNM